MLVAITGTPGTGKSSITSYLENKGHIVLRLNEIAIENKFIIGYDKERRCYVIDVKKLSNHINEKYGNLKDIIFLDGHISHLVDNLDIVIVLRTDPKELKDRLLRKKWGKQKIRENLEAEILDIITIEALEKYPAKKIYEIDTTNKEIPEVSSIILNIIYGRFKNNKMYAVGKINWLNEKNLELLK